MLFKPFDPVVATRASRATADDAVTLLVRAGYGRAMLAVVGADDAAAASTHRPSNATPWITSGAPWGLLWIALAVLAARTLPLGGPAFGALVMAGALALVAQATIAARLVAPERDQAGPAPRASGTTAAEPSSFAVLVRGSRSDVALARAILAV